MQAFYDAVYEEGSYQEARDEGKIWARNAEDAERQKAARTRDLRRLQRLRYVITERLRRSRDPVR